VGAKHKCEGGKLTSEPVAVRTVDLSREFLRRKSTAVLALDRICLSIPTGEVHGLLGPNGAGKTTLFKILTTILLPTSGKAEICGHDVVTASRAVRPLIGIVFGGDRGLYTRLTARQNLEYWGALYRLQHRVLRARIEEVLIRVGLADAAGRRVETYSRGMKQRLHLARGLLADAQVLFLDEPTNGLDPIGALEFRELIGQLREEKRTIVLATHDMREAEALCDRVTLVDHGTIIATESPRSLAAFAAQVRRIETEGADAQLLAQIRDVPGVAEVTGNVTSARIKVRTEDALSQVLKTLVDAGVTAVTTGWPSLEEIYLQLMRSGREED
jgi:ABC-2 type transport system ATP-binding protein